MSCDSDDEIFWGPVSKKEIKLTLESFKDTGSAESRNSKIEPKTMDSKLSNSSVISISSDNDSFLESNDKENISPVPTKQTQHKIESNILRDRDALPVVEETGSASTMSDDTKSISSSFLQKVVECFAEGNGDFDPSCVYNKYVRKSPILSRIEEIQSLNTEMSRQNEDAFSEIEDKSSGFSNSTSQLIIDLSNLSVDGRPDTGVELEKSLGCVRDHGECISSGEELDTSLSELAEEIFDNEENEDYSDDFEDVDTSHSSVERCENTEQAETKTVLNEVEKQTHFGRLLSEDSTHEALKSSSEGSFMDSSRACADHCEKIVAEGVEDLRKPTLFGLNSRNGKNERVESSSVDLDSNHDARVSSEEFQEQKIDDGSVENYQTNRMREDKRQEEVEPSSSDLNTGSLTSKHDSQTNDQTEKIRLQVEEMECAVQETNVEPVNAGNLKDRVNNLIYSLGNQQMNRTAVDACQEGEEKSTSGDLEQDLNQEEMEHGQENIDFDSLNDRVNGFYSTIEKTPHGINGPPSETSDAEGCDLNDRTVEDGQETEEDDWQASDQTKPINAPFIDRNNGIIDFENIETNQDCFSRSANTFCEENDCCSSASFENDDDASNESKHLDSSLGCREIMSPFVAKSKLIADRETLGGGLDNNWQNALAASNDTFISDQSMLAFPNSILEKTNLMQATNNITRRNLSNLEEEESALEVSSRQSLGDESCSTACEDSETEFNNTLEMVERLLQMEAAKTPPAVQPLEKKPNIIEESPCRKTTPKLEQKNTNSKIPYPTARMANSLTKSMGDKFQKHHKPTDKTLAEKQSPSARASPKTSTKPSLKFTPVPSKVENITPKTPGTKHPSTSSAAKHKTPQKSTVDSPITSEVNELTKSLGKTSEADTSIVNLRSTLRRQLSDLYIEPSPSNKQSAAKSKAQVTTPKVNVKREQAQMFKTPTVTKVLKHGSTGKSTAPRNILSPISYYINKAPKSPLVVKCDHSKARPRGVVANADTHRPAEAYNEVAAIQTNPLPFCAYKSAPNVKLVEDKTHEVPKSVRRFFPVTQYVIKHEARIKTEERRSPRLHNDSLHALDNSTSIFNASASSHDVSVRVQRSALRTPKK